MMTALLRAAVRRATWGMLLAMVVTPLHAQNFPVKQIRLIVPFAPGGGNDVFGRMFALRMSEAFGQSVIVDNRPGGGGNIGTELVAHAPADGYMLLYTTNSFAIGPALYARLGYNISELAPLSQIADFPIAIVIHPSVPAKTIRELVTIAKKRGGINYGSTGTGSTNHLTGVLFNNVAGINNVHIPYKGAGPMLTALLSGEVEMATPTVFSAAPYVRSGRLRAIAVTSLKPSATLPGVPTMASIYPGFDTSVWHGFLTTAGTPQSVIATLHREIIRALHTPEIRGALDDGGAQTIGSTPAEFAAVLAAEVEKYAKLVKISGAKAD